jgi:hypothetical protein
MNELDELKSLAYMVDQRNDHGEGNVITYKDALAGVDASCAAWKKEHDKVKLENTTLKQALEEAEGIIREIHSQDICNAHAFGDELHGKIKRFCRSNS